MRPLTGAYNDRVYRVAVSSTVILILAITGCTTPKRPLAPRNSRPDTHARSVAGTYCFVSLQQNFREYNGAIGSLIPRGLAPNSVVSVRQEPAGVVLEYVGVDGVRDQVAWPAPGEWRNGKLVMPVPNGGNPFGWYYSRSWITMYRLQDGRLVVQRNDADTGLTCLFIPSHDKRESMLVLERGESCPAG